MIENAVVKAAIQSLDPSLPVNDYLATLPPLHPQTTNKNFFRFVSRCGPIFAFRDQVILLLSWDQPIDTLVALIAYCFICKFKKIIRKNRGHIIKFICLFFKTDFFLLF